MAYRLRASKPFTAEFRAVAESQLSRAIRLLEDQPETPHEAVHAARKRFKRLRALYRLVAPDAKAFRHRENARIRDVAKTLSAVRDATALIETVDYLATHAGSDDELAALKLASEALTERRNRIAEEEQDLPAKITAASAACREAIAALEELDLDDRPGPTAKRLAKAWKKQREKADTALAACDSQSDAEHYHELRKAGQAYWMHLSLLRDAWPSAMLAKQQKTKELVDILGHEHDLSVLTGLVNESPDLFGDSDTLARVLGAIIARQQALRQEALERAHEVFSETAERESDLIATLWHEAIINARKQRKAKKKYKTSQPAAKESAPAA
ncbi:metal-binding protein [Neorhizobium sp. SOG26]|uniref:CHAD domain-containing protein n=1 Tax=Neorhizobium sp. SOG26 TaxID=2060726 RepID=UPI000E58B211|nr:CHAD domain-containing protein [Neorhizobium sp. SOG26]AXV16248.1 metal-binding protein [Neorhizobium sp. SOG26]